MKRLLCVSNRKNITLNGWRANDTVCVAMLNKMHIYKSILCPVVLYSYTTVMATNTAPRNSRCNCTILFIASYLWEIFKIDERT